ncbi:hemerythrin domain-containing protein [Motiliproteus sp. MSK22-1]|uniref:hemerythrin domain-containing protein n=1 Tax=Motiliproteus sp. MSK22-1 TaxID=1897630 RepID=UPI0013017A9B|nr:hemerythrin domain-containing protein [Motiliproteus sp. MSK22-1]
MTLLMNDLRQDHKHISALLTILKNKLSTLKMGSHPNFALMAEVVDYLTDYADDYHHGKENLIYHYMQEHYPKKSNLISQQFREHEELRVLTKQLSATIDQALMDMPFLLEEFAAQLEQFVDRQSQHLFMEDSKIFPAIEQVLSSDDWAKLSDMLPKREDPLFGESREAHYQALYDALIEDLT